MRKDFNLRITGPLDCYDWEVRLTVVANDKSMMKGKTADCTPRYAQDTALALQTLPPHELKETQKENIQIPCPKLQFAIHNFGMFAPFYIQVTHKEDEESPECDGQQQLQTSPQPYSCYHGRAGLRCCQLAEGEEESRHRCGALEQRHTSHSGSLLCLTC